MTSITDNTKHHQ